MCDSNVIERLYANVLHEDVNMNRVRADEIRTAIWNMKEVYKPEINTLDSSTLNIADYNDISHRCAYLHKYAPLHTALTADVLEKVLIQNVKCIKDLLNKHGQLNVCSIGGGPGCDVIAAIAVLHEAFGYFQINATILDIMIEWRHTFHSIIQELKFGEYGLLSSHVSEQYLNWSYEQANLIGKMTNEVNRAIGSAHLITMVKFVSASSCKDTPIMIGNIFRTMKPGSLVLFIDNAGGGSHKVVNKVATACGLRTVFGPFYEHYKNQSFDTKRYGFAPCLETQVIVHLWRKGHATGPGYSLLASMWHAISRIKINVFNTSASRGVNMDPVLQCKAEAGVMHEQRQLLSDRTIVYLYFFVVLVLCILFYFSVLCDRGYDCCRLAKIPDSRKTPSVR